MLRTAFVILSGNAAASLLLLVRNLLIARLISVEDYGIAATFGIIMALIEMASYLGLQQQIVQSKDGEDPRFQAALQGFQVLRGVVAAMVLLVSAELIARFLGVPEIAWAYQVVALVPLLNAFQHFDIHRMNRKMQFGPLILTGTVPAGIALLSVWPLYLWFGDYRVMLWSMMLQFGLVLTVSHLVAKRPYRLVFDRAIMGTSLKFGWPLLVNGFLMFAVFQGDKLIVGRVMGMETLAIFAMGMTLTLTPTLVMAKSLQNFFLPQLTASNSDFSRFAPIAVEVSIAMGLILILAVMIIGQQLTHLLLGDKYLALLPLLTWFAIMQALRVFKAGPAVVALARGQTSNAMFANISRVVFLPFAWYIATSSGDLLFIIIAAAIAEAFGHIIAMAQLHYRTGLSFSRVWVSHLGAISVIATVILQIYLASLYADPIQSIGFTIGIGAMGCLGLIILTSPHLRAYLFRKRVVS